VENFAHMRVASAQSQRDGSFTINLSPGTYFIEAQSLEPGYPGSSGPMAIQVRPLGYSMVQLTTQIAGGSLEQ
jgi:hypothetical protein